MTSLEDEASRVAKSQIDAFNQDDLELKLTDVEEDSLIIDV